MELMAINLHRLLLNSTNGGVHMHHWLNSTETLKTVVFIAVFLGPFLLVLFRLCSWAAKVVKALVAADDGEALVAEVAAARAELVRAAVAAAEAAAVQAAESAAVEAGLKKHEMRLLLTAMYRLDRDGAGCECTICLGDFVDGEMVRILPCCHRFHVRCIDKWLVSQVSCPNCRISLLQHVINI